MTKQRLTITFEHSEGMEQASFERQDILGSDVFWSWFLNAWPCIGLDFVKKALESEADTRGAG